MREKSSSATVEQLAAGAFEVACVVCGGWFLASHRDARYCSRSCQRVSQRLSSPRAAECLECGRQVAPEIGSEGFCSTDCREVDRWRRSVGEAHPRQDLGRRSFVCEQCSTRFMAGWSASEP